MASQPPTPNYVEKPAPYHLAAAVLPSVPTDEKHAGATLPSDEKLIEAGTLEQITAGSESGTEQDKESQKDGKIDHAAKLQDQTHLLPFKQLIIVYCGLAFAMFCGMLNQTIVSTALPALGAVFHEAEIASWIGTAYLLTSTACQPLYGRLTDIFGRKVCLMASLGIFLLGAILCAVSQSITMLIISRAIGGIGGGGLITTVQIVISDVVSLKDRGKYQGIIGVVVAIGTAIGPVIGGVFAKPSLWRWCFYISIPLTVAAMVVIFFALPLKKVEGNAKDKLKKIDGWGCLISFLASIAILLPVSWAGTRYSWGSVAVILPLVLGLVLVVAFLFVEFKVAKIPLIPLHMFRNPHVASCIFTSFLTGFMTFTNLYYLPQYYQVARGDTALRSGIMILPLVVTQIVTSFTSGFAVSKWSCYRINMIAGYFLWTIASGLFTTITPHTSDGELIGIQILSGIGSGQTLQVTLVALQAAVKRNEMAVVTGARNYLRMMGSTLAIAACAAILNNMVRSRLESLGFAKAVISDIVSNPTKISTMALTAAQKNDALNAYARGIQVTYIMMTVMGGVQFILVCVFVKNYSLRRDDDEKQKAAAKAWLQERKAGKNGSGDVATKSTEGTPPPTAEQMWEVGKKV